jgi:prepilin-type N-terminal cleavage/methylation domain-containing protein
MAPRPALSDERGFTLPELLVALTVLAMMMAGLFSVQQAGHQAYLVGSARVEVQQNARGALDLMMTEIRSAQGITAVGASCGTGPVPTGGGATGIAVTDQTGAAVVYQLAGSDLQRNGIVLVGGVATLRIWCYDGTGTLTASPAGVRTVHVWLRTGTESSVAATAARNRNAVVEARVRLRNLL